MIPIPIHPHPHPHPSLVLVSIMQVRAIKKLKVLGNGHFEIVTIGRQQYVRSVPGELNLDSSRVIEMAQVGVNRGRMGVNRGRMGGRAGPAAQFSLSAMTPCNDLTPCNCLIPLSRIPLRPRATSRGRL